MQSLYYLCIPLLFIVGVVGYLDKFDDALLENAEFYAGENSERPVRRILQGRIRAVNLMSRSKRQFFGFQGIPYAQPPIGNLRFKGPLPAAAWSGIRDGGIISDPCPQMNAPKIFGNEDCLHLNVFTPRLPVTENSTLLPVMVYVFGGGFTTGLNSPLRYGPQFILDKDIVLVTPNYRMGILGYLSTGDEISPGNYGLKDLVLALKWIQGNIRYFGGDPNRVTLTGGSSGAMTVHLLTLSDLTKGLFHRYITQSGSALSRVAYVPRQESAKRATQLGKFLGCPTNTSAILVDCLRGFNASQIVNMEPMFLEWNLFPRVVWGPTVELEMEGALLTDSPANLFAAGKIRDLPWIESLTSDEGILVGAWFYDRPDRYQQLFSNLDTVLPIILQYRDSVDNVQMFTDALKSYYLNDLTADPNVLLTNFSQLTGDCMITYPSYSAFQQQLIHATQPQYRASFEYRGTVSYSYMFSNGSTKNWGVAHGDELLYLLPGLDSLFGPPGWKFNENDWKMVDTMVQLWTSFVNNGAPSISELNSTVVWEPYSLQHNYLRIGKGPDTTLEVGYNLLMDRMKFWEELNAATSWRNIT